MTREAIVKILVDRLNRQGGIDEIADALVKAYDALPQKQLVIARTDMKIDLTGWLADGYAVTILGAGGAGGGSKLLDKKEESK